MIDSHPPPPIPNVTDNNHHENAPCRGASKEKTMHKTEALMETLKKETQEEMNTSFKIAGY